MEQLRQLCLEEGKGEAGSRGYSALTQAPSEWSHDSGKPCSGERLLLMFDRWRKLAKVRCLPCTALCCCALRPCLEAPVVPLPRSRGVACSHGGRSREPCTVQAWAAAQPAQKALWHPLWVLPAWILQCTSVSGRLVRPSACGLAVSRPGPLLRM